MPRVLLVDDDELLSELLEMHLDLAGYEVDRAAEGAEALERLEGADYAAVILDLMMPVLDGMRFMRLLNERSEPPPPVIVLSALERAETKEALLADGVHAVVRKPVDAERLIERLAEITG